MSTANIPPRLIPASRALTAAQFQGLAEVPPELEWFANIPNEKTRRAYRLDITDFGAFVGINRTEEFRFGSCVATVLVVVFWSYDRLSDRRVIG
jgi:integrase/recombinase XerD